MNVLLTGASSFTGLWFARALRAAGHSVVAPLPRPRGGYDDVHDGVRAARVAALQETDVRIVWDCPFGSPAFLEHCADAEVLCHHAAHVEGYKSLDFDVAGALAANTRGLRQVLERGRAAGWRGVVLTGTVFEADEGAGETPLRAFSPYGVSKALTFQVMRYWTALHGLPLVKFVIPNPFGPWEEPRFCGYLLQCWARGEVAHVKTPVYVRDNIHVSLLAGAYVRALQRLDAGSPLARCNPSGYVETQGAFALRFAAEIGRRLDLPTPVALDPQTNWEEPRTRINTERVDGSAWGWNEAAAWDELAAWYAREHPALGARRSA